MRNLGVVWCATALLCTAQGCVAEHAPQQGRDSLREEDSESTLGGQNGEGGSVQVDASSGATMDASAEHSTGPGGQDGGDRGESAVADAGAQPAHAEASNGTARVDAASAASVSDLEGQI